MIDERKVLERHEKVVARTRGIVFVCLGLMFLVNFFYKDKDSDMKVYMISGIALVTSLAFFYRLFFEMRNKIFDPKRKLFAIVFLFISVLIMIYFWKLE
ncbi:hypothetical protein LZZ90_00230 [Flavobacterium sp. SM15]|uniref:hypothetical protein n=1 Tax=Flavobacterium sp. SM15 TaxID=2908005 RepID=UPI001EDC6BEE|nr:hypothetical protein [Flavobacterium sp. SM15]MCG2609928.1 hypothetical protein [Flavobacterium sp. SM15]